MYWVNSLYIILSKIVTFCLGKYLCLLLYLLMFMWHNLMRWCFWFNLGNTIMWSKMLDVIYTYKDKAGLVGCYLQYTYKDKAGLVVGFYLHVQRKKLDLLDFTYMYKEKSWTCCWIIIYMYKEKSWILTCTDIEKSWTCWMLSILQRKKLDLFR